MEQERFNRLRVITVTDRLDLVERLCDKGAWSDADSILRPFTRAPSFAFRDRIIELENRIVDALIKVQANEL